MDPLTRLLLRLALWFRQPPSRSHVILIFVVLALCLVIVGIERIFGWPEWLRTQPMPIRRA